MQKLKLDTYLAAPTINDPADIIGLAYRGGDIVSMVRCTEGRLSHGVEAAPLLMDLSLLYQLAGQREHALKCQAGALEFSQLYRNRLSGKPVLRLLLFVTYGDLTTNTPVDLLVQEQAIEVTRLFVLPGRPRPERLPDHDLAMVGIGEGDNTREALATLETWLQDWPRPVLNRPDRVLDLARDRLCRVLDGAEQVAIPPTWRCAAAGLQQAPFPVIVRPIDSHAGQGLEQLMDAAQVADYVARNPADHYYVSPFIDYAGPDGRYRKMRIAFFGGQTHLCHMAVGDHWMVHYLNAGMEASAEKREEEARCMASFNTVFVPRHHQALTAIQQRIGLDYMMIDCAETPDGRLLVFEASIIGIVHAMEPETVYPYKKPHMQGIFAAFARFLHESAANR